MASHACDTTKDSINGTALQSCSTGYSNGITELVKTDDEWQLLVGGWAYSSTPISPSG